ncbi:MAG: hypothetical protein AAF991_12625, partial [Pseudomonadota bacterium]
MSLFGEKPRGATLTSGPRSSNATLRIERHHVLIVGAVSVCVAVFSLFTPSSEVAANKPVLPPEPS